jgi:hypothetical protein
MDNRDVAKNQIVTTFGSSNASYSTEIGRPPHRTNGTLLFYWSKEAERMLYGSGRE